MFLTFEVDLDMLPLDPRAKIQVCMSVRLAARARHTDRQTEISFYCAPLFLIINDNQSVWAFAVIFFRFTFLHVLYLERMNTVRNLKNNVERPGRGNSGFVLICMIYRNHSQIALMSQLGTWCHRLTHLTSPTVTHRWIQCMFYHTSASKCHTPRYSASLSMRVVLAH